MMTPEQEQEFRQIWRIATRQIVDRLTERGENLIQIMKQGDYPQSMVDMRATVMGLMQHNLSSLSEQIKDQRLHERQVDDLVNLFGLKPDDDNLNP